jgi:hypothetical protein
MKIRLLACYLKQSVFNLEFHVYDSILCQSANSKGKRAMQENLGLLFVLDIYMPCDQMVDKCGASSSSKS